MQRTESNRDRGRFTPEWSKENKPWLHVDQSKVNHPKRVDTERVLAFRTVKEWIQGKSENGRMPALDHLELPDRLPALGQREDILSTTCSRCAVLFRGFIREFALVPPEGGRLLGSLLSRDGERREVSGECGDESQRHEIRIGVVPAREQEEQAA